MTTPKLDAYFATLEKHLPVFTPDDQRVALAIYRELSKGRPVTDEALARRLGVTPEVAAARRRSEAVACFAYENDDGDILGFGGLAAARMHHSFTVDGVNLSTWCAWDSLFVPELLGRTAHVESASPDTGAMIRLTVSPDGVEQLDPRSAVVSFLLPKEELSGGAQNIMTTFCHFVFFFEHQKAGEEWAAKHPGTFLYPVAAAVDLARRLNERNFGVALREERVNA